MFARGIGFVDPFEAFQRGIAKIRGLLVAVNEYQDYLLSPLRYAVQDCEELCETLREATEEFPNRDFSPLTYMSGGQPFSIADLESELNRLLSDIKPQDTFLFYFSGHGVLEPETQQLYLCLPQTQINDLPNTGLSIQNLLKRIKDSQVGKQVVILDACHSGNVHGGAKDKDVGAYPRSGETPVESDAEPDPNLMPKLEAALEAYSHTGSQDFFALLSCTANQKSWEVPELGHGVFTHFLIEGLRGAVGDDLGRIKIDRLYEHVRDRTQIYLRNQYGKLQTPNRIAKGAQDIILGLVDRSQDDERWLTTGGGTLSLEDEYSRYVWQLLRDQRDFEAPETRQALVNFARQRSLYQEITAHVEADTRRRFESVLAGYRQETLSMLLEQAFQAVDRFASHRSQVQKTWNLKPENLIPLEESAIAEFKQERDQYFAAYLQAILTQLTISSSTQTELRSPLLAQSFALTVLEEIEQAAAQVAVEQQQRYRRDYRALIHQHESPDKESFRKSHQVFRYEEHEFRLGESLMQAIEAEENKACEGHQQSYFEAVKSAYHQVLQPDLEQVRSQEPSGLGATILEQIETAARAVVEPEKQEYADAYGTAIRQSGEDLSNAVERSLLNMKLRLQLSSAVTDGLRHQEQVAFRQDQAEYEQAFSQALHQEYPLRSRASLQRQAAAFKFGPDVVKSLEANAQKVFERHKEDYLELFRWLSRQRDRLLTEDHAQLHQRQVDDGFEPEVIEDMIAADKEQLNQDKQSCEHELDQLLRRDQLTDETRTQLQERFEFGELLLETLEVRVRQVFEQDCQKYQQEVERQLSVRGSLNSEARKWLQKRQEQWRLNHSSIVAGIEQRAEFEQAERERQAELDLARLVEEPRQPQSQQPISEQTFDQEEEPTNEPGLLSSSELLPPGPVSTPSEPTEIPAVAPAARPLPHPRLLVAAVGLIGAIGLVVFLLRPKTPETPQSAPSPTASVQPRSYQTELTAAKELIQNREFAKAIATAQTIPSDAPEFTEAKQVIEAAEKGIQQTAERYYNQGELKKAIATINLIPNTSSLYSGVQPKINTWTKNWNTDEARYKTVEKANSPDTVIREAGKIKHPFWKQKVSRLVQKAKDTKNQAIPTAPAPAYPSRGNYEAPAPENPASNYSPPKFIPQRPVNVDPPTSYPPRQLNVDPPTSYPPSQPIEPDECPVVEGKEQCSQ